MYCQHQDYVMVKLTVYPSLLVAYFSILMRRFVWLSSSSALHDIMFSVSSQKSSYSSISFSSAVFSFCACQFWFCTMSSLTFIGVIRIWSEQHWRPIQGRKAFGKYDSSFSITFQFVESLPSKGSRTVKQVAYSSLLHCIFLNNSMFLRRI